MADEKNELYNKSDNILFESQQEWETFLTQFIRHLLHRYGENIISEWIFEFGFFLIQKPYYISEKYNATDTWDKGYEIIKSEIPSVQIAGPGLVSHQDQDFLRKIINNFFCAKHKPDLFTTVHFPYASSKNKGDLDALPSRTYTKISNDIHFLQEGIETIRSILLDMGFKGKHVVAEWNYSISNRNYLQDSCFRACYIMENILQNMDKCDTMALWYATDLINVSYDSVRVLSGSAGLVSVDGICKPSFYAFSFLKKIGRYKLYQKDNLLITADSKEQFYILCCNSRPLGVKYYLTDEKDYGPEDLETLFNSADNLSEQIIIDGLNDGDIYTIRNQILNNHKGSVLERWISLSCNDALSFDDISYLKQISIPEITMERLIVEHGKLTLKLNLQPDEIRAISIIKN